ncbi:probable assembly chaperone of rpl4 isoform X1 [Megalobrama amblycephala]|uniref:probable assembly chaperone of rpl4 isoform X1 n=2 Tax=Megalobrama amblycephala TaxID=75352 RepID=UPI002014771A|nr:probable assembly chaperone of rpl4 isoform X1 [Megalobrama amblycephala]
MGGQAKAKKKNKAKRKDTKPNGGALMSPQERMRAKMQERAKKKTAEKYTVDQLLEKTEECIDNFDFDMARLYCQRALDIEPTNLTILDMLGNICAELGDVEKAKQVYLKAVELSPEEGHSKYMYLGQIHTGMEAVQYFSKGTEVMLNTMDKHTNEASAFGAAAFPSEGAVTKKEVSVAFCSIAEIFFTDLCMEEGAADRCKEAIDKALLYDEHNPEALQLMASYLFSIEKTEEGREYLKKSVSSWLPSLQKKEESSASAAHDMEEEENQTKSNIPPYESRITTAKLLIEAEEYEMATEVLEDLLEEDDEVVEVWYLLGWLFYLQLDKQDPTNNSVNFRKSAWTCLSKAKKLYVKLRCEDAPMFEHTEQLLAELGGEEHGVAAADDDDDDDEAGPSLEDIEDDFIQSSDEEEDAMDH